MENFPGTLQLVLGILLPVHFLDTDLAPVHLDIRPQVQLHQDSPLRLVSSLLDTTPLVLSVQSLLDKRLMVQCQMGSHSDFRQSQWKVLLVPYCLRMMSMVRWVPGFHRKMLMAQRSHPAKRVHFEFLVNQVAVIPVIPAVPAVLVVPAVPVDPVASNRR